MACLTLTAKKWPLRTALSRTWKLWIHWVWHLPSALTTEVL
jgi:hypothetical protein